MSEQHGIRVSIPEEVMFTPNMVPAIQERVREGVECLTRKGLKVNFFAAFYDDILKTWLVDVAHIPPGQPNPPRFPKEHYDKA